MARFVQINDIHLADRAPQWRTDTYLDDIFEKLRWVKAWAYDHQVDAILLTGDIFHSQNPRNVSHALVQRVFDWLNLWHVPTYIAPGNHDLGAAGAAGIDRQPLGVVARHPDVLCGDGEWSLRTQDGSLCRIATVGWDYDMAAETIRRQVELDPCQTGGQQWPDVIVAHAPITATASPFYPTIQPEALDGAASVVCHGHLHAPEALVRTSQTVFSNPGALARGNLANDLDRMPHFAVIDLIPARTGFAVKVWYEPIACAKPGREVFRAEEAAQQQTDRAAIATFIESLAGAKLEAVTVESLIDAASKLVGHDAHLRALVTEILQSVR